MSTELLRFAWRKLGFLKFIAFFCHLYIIMTMFSDTTIYHCAKLFPAAVIFIAYELVHRFHNVTKTSYDFFISELTSDKQDSKC